MSRVSIETVPARSNEEGGARASIPFGFGLWLVVSLVGMGRTVDGQDSGIRLTLKTLPDKSHPKDEFLDVTIGGKPFTLYHFNRAHPRPFFWPIRTRNGDIITQPLKSANGPRHDDYPHRGLSFAVDRVNGIDYWSEQGGIIFFALNRADSGENPAQFKIHNAWLDRRREHVLVESATVSIYPNRLITYDATLTAQKKPVTFEDTEEGLFGLRLVESMCESAGGKVVSSDGRRGTSECWGKSFDWIDCHGPVQGHTVGVAIFDNPQNFRHSRYQVSKDGLFSINPFGEHAYTNGKNPAKPVHLDPGANLRLRYGIYVHDGDTKTANVANVFRVYVAESRD
jgi:hypothetical protein